MEKHKSSELSVELRQRIYKTYKYKMHNTTMTYGLAIVLADPVIVYLLLKYIFTKDILKISFAYAIVISLIALMIAYLHIFYIKDIIITTRKLKNGLYDFGVGKLTAKEDIGGQESEKIGYSRLSFKIDNKYKSKVLVYEDYRVTNIGDECTVLFFGNKPVFAFNNSSNEMQKYIDNFENTDKKKKKHKNNRKLHLRDIFKRKRGIKGIFSGIVEAYDKVLENGDNINEEEEENTNE